MTFVGSDQLRYCMRVQFQDKTWILVQKDAEHFNFLDVDLIPIDKVRSLPALETHSSKQEALF